MKLLLDTHAFLWFAEGDPRLSRTARRRIEDARNVKLLSAASIWEMAIKIGLGKLRLRISLAEYIQRGAPENEITVLSVTREHALAVGDLPHHHSDPFDRLLVAQTSCEGATLVSGDTSFDAYEVRRVW